MHSVVKWLKFYFIPQKMSLFLKNKSNFSSLKGAGFFNSNTNDWHNSVNLEFLHDVDYLKTCQERKDDLPFLTPVGRKRRKYQLVNFTFPHQYVECIKVLREERKKIEVHLHN